MDQPTVAAVVVSTVDVQPGQLLRLTAPALTSHEAHIWNFSLGASESWRAICEQPLSSDEVARASRFHFERDALRFKIARGTVRVILGAYLNVPAGELRFVSTKNGKPSLVEPKSDLRFNLSHSADRGMLGVAMGREIGVDVEAIRPDVETDKLAERFFSQRERESIRALPQPDRVSAFFRCWSCKEAFLKAQGVGLSRGLGSFDVEVNSARPAHLIATRPDAGEATKWHLHEVKGAAGYAAAVAVEGSIREIKILNCPAE
ncbi:MAG: 4'-phosphopantetheinyl transferase superfamily protein [Candidatus Sulfotelmatobacter sp.]